MAIRVALHHRTSYRFDRPVSLSPHEIRLRPAPHCRTPIASYSLRVALGLALGGIFGSIVAGVYVKSLDLRTVRWLVIVVVVYTAVTMLWSAFSDRGDTVPQTPPVRK